MVTNRDNLQMIISHAIVLMCLSPALLNIHESHLI